MTEAETGELPKHKIVRYFIGRYHCPAQGVTAFMYMYSSGKLVMDNKYRWVVRITYTWYAFGDEKDWTVKLYPDLIAAPLEAKMRAESFMTKRGYERVFPSASRLAHERDLMAELGLEANDCEDCVCAA